MWQLSEILVALSLLVFFLFVLYFSLVFADMKQALKLVFHTTQSTRWEISIKCLSQGHNDVMQYEHRTSNLTITNSPLKSIKLRYRIMLYL